MLTILENMRLEAVKYRPSAKSCQGSEVKGHFRVINGQRVWVEAFSRNAHQRSYRRS